MEKEKHIYTEEELDEIRGWVLDREDFKNTGECGRSNPGASILGTAIFTGILTLIFLYGPVWVLFTLSNNSLDGSFHYISLDYVLTNTATGETGFNPMAFLFSSFIVVLAVIGGASIVGWLAMLGSSSNDNKWYEKEIEKSEKMCEAAVQEAEKPLKEEILNLQSQLGQQQVAYDLLAKQSAKLQSQMKDNNETFKREKKLWALEKKELQYQIKLKQGLVDEMDDADSPLGGLYN